MTLIEQLRKGQAAPARVLDQISRSVPDRLWLADLKQAGNDFTLDGFATSMTALSDFVVGIEGTKWFRKPVEIIDSQVTSDAKNGRSGAVHREGQLLRSERATAARARQGRGEEVDEG